MTTPVAPTAREQAETAMTRMLGAVRAQRLQLQTLAPGVGGPSTMTVARQIEGLQNVETLLPALALYARQLEGAVGALGHLTVTGGSGDAEAVAANTKALADGLAVLVAELHEAHTAPPAPRLLELVLALQTAGASPVPVTIPPSAPTFLGLVVSIGSQAQAWKDGYTAGYRQAWADVLATIRARL